MTAADDEKRRTRLPTPNGDAPLVNEHEATAAPALRGVDAVSRAAALHARLVESVRDYAIFALDPQGYVLTWNPGAQRFKGYLAGEIIGRHFSTFYPPEDIAAGKPAVVHEAWSEQP